MSEAGRTVAERPDGGVVVRRERKLTARKKRDVLAMVGAGSSQAAAARAVEVSPRTLARELASDAEFAAQMEAALGGYAISLAGVAHDLATEGSVREFYDRKTGELIRREFVPNTKLMERMLEAYVPERFKREQAPAVVVIAPMSSEELAQMRVLGREQGDAIEVLALEMADAEREREAQAAGR